MNLVHFTSLTKHFWLNDDCPLEVLNVAPMRNVICFGCSPQCAQTPLLSINTQLDIKIETKSWQWYHFHTCRPIYTSKYVMQYIQWLISTAYAQWKI